MKGLLCGKMSLTYQNVEMSVTYQNVEIGKGSTALYKVGPRSQQCGTGADGASTYKLPLPQAQNQNDSALSNLLTSYSVYFRSQSPDSSNCCSSLAPLNMPISSPCDDGGEDKSPVSSVFSSLSSLGGAADCQTSSEDGASTGLARAESKCWGPASNCSTDSIGQVYDDEKNSSVSDLGGIAASVEVGARLLQNYYTQAAGVTGLLHLNDVGSELSSSSSSIGNRSEDSAGSIDNEDSDMEVESTLRKGPLDMMNTLECSLPIKRGLSRFWSGKSKSFTSLGDVSTVADLVKPENPFNKRRRYTTFADRHRSFPPLSKTSTAGISKRPPSGYGRSNLAVAVAMGSKLEGPSKLSSSTPTLPSAGRSFSLTDLQQASYTVSPPPTPAVRTRRD